MTASNNKIKVTNKLENDSLFINFMIDDSNTKSIQISIANDVDFQKLIDYLIELIPENRCLDFEFENTEEGINKEKFELIKNIVSQIYEKYNDALNNDVESNYNTPYSSSYPYGKIDDNELPF